MRIPQKFRVRSLQQSQDYPSLLQWAKRHQSQLSSPPLYNSPSSNTEIPTFPLHTLSSSTGAAGISSHGDGLLVLLDVLEEGHGALELPAIDGLGGLAGVLEGHTKVSTAGAGRLRGLDLGRGVSDLENETSRVRISVICPYICHE